MVASPWSVGSHQQSEALVTEDDGWWFGTHPDRTLRARPSLPFELVSWGPLTHHDQNWMLVRVERSRDAEGFTKLSRYQRVGVVLRHMALPDDEAALARLWAHYEQLVDQGDGLRFLNAEEIGDAVGVPAYG